MVGGWGDLQTPPWDQASPPGADPLGVGLENLLARSPSTSPLGAPGQIYLNFPLWRGPGDTPGQIPLNLPLGVGLETPQPDPPKLPPWVWAWKPARHAGIPPPPGDLLLGMLRYHLQGMLGYHPLETCC